MSLENDPIFQQKPGLDFGYHEPPSQCFRLRFSCPFLSAPVSFGSCAYALGLHPLTASILDDMQVLIEGTLNPLPNSLPEETEVFKATASYIHNRLLDLGAVPGSAARGAPAAVSEPVSTPEVLVPKAAKGGLGKLPTPHSLLPKYPSIGSGSNIAPSSSSISVSTHATSKTISPGSSLEITSVPDPDDAETTAMPRCTEGAPPLDDPLHTAIMTSSALYTRTIILRQPFSAVVTESDALAVLAATWRIPLTRWRSVIGVLLFVLMPILPTVSKSPRESGGLGMHAGFVKSILQIGFMQMAIEDWEVCRVIMERVAKLGAWLRGSNDDSRGDGPDSRN